MSLSDTYCNVLFAITAIIQVVIFVGSTVALVRGFRAKTDDYYKWLTPFVMTTIHMAVGGFAVATEGFYPDKFAGVLWLALLGPFTAVLRCYKLSDSMVNLVFVLNLLFWLGIPALVFSL